MSVTLLSARSDVFWAVTPQQTIGTGATQARMPLPLRSGTTDFPEFTRLLTNGTGANQATNQWSDCRTLAASTREELHLNGTLSVLASGTTETLVNAAGVTLAFTRIVWFLCRVRDPAAGKRIVLGDADTNPWLAWFGTNPDATEEVRVDCLKRNDIDGWAVTGSSAVLRVANPSSVSVVYDIAIVGSP